MRKAQIKQLEQMLNTDDVLGKKLIRRLLWLNTTTPKYKVGDCVKVTDRARKIYGVRVENFNAKIVNVVPDVNNHDDVYRYELSMTIISDDETDRATIFKYENDISVMSNTDINRVNSTSLATDEIDIYI